MAFPGRIKLAGIPQNHPFARPENNFGVNRPSEARPRKLERDGLAATITVKWGYECHSIRLSPAQWFKVRTFKPLNIAGPGYYYEGDFFQDYWSFWSPGPHELVVTYGDDGGTGFNGSLTGAQIEEYLPGVGNPP